MTMDAVNAARKAFDDVVNAGGMANHDATAKAAQAVTEARYQYWAEHQALYPTDYPPPKAGDGKAVFEAADESGEGVLTRKELSKYIARNTSTIRMLLKGAYQIFADQFQTDDLSDIKCDEFMEIWQRAVALRDEELAKKDAEKPSIPANPGAADAAPERHAELPTRQRPAASYEEMVPEGVEFKFSLGHQEMSRVMKELETIFASQPCEWLPVDAMANLLAIELGYEDVAEFEDALGGEFSDFVKGLPNAELSKNERGTDILKIKKDVMGPCRKMTLKVTERKQLWHVLMQAPDARITIAELEFEFQPMGERRIDTLYNHIGSAIWNLGQYVRDHARQGGLGGDTENKILDTIHLLNAALDVENPFTIIVDDPTSRSLWQPIDGVDIEYLDTPPAQAA